MSAPVLPLVCPRCRTAVTAGPEGASCETCRAFYPTRDGVLHLVAGRVGEVGFDPHYFPTLAAVEREHYWFASRRQVVRDVLRAAVPDLAHRALFDLGCGTGGLLRFLADSGIALAGACDAYPESLAIARRLVEAPLVLVDEGRFPPLGPGTACWASSTCSSTSTTTSARCATLLGPRARGSPRADGAGAPFLFDEMDTLAHHRRRYRRPSCGQSCETPASRCGGSSHFMAPIVPLVAVRWLVRAASRGRRSAERRRMELRVVPGLNGLMRAVLALERPLVRAGRLPFGSSLIAVAARPRWPNGAV